MIATDDDALAIGELVEEAHKRADRQREPVAIVREGDKLALRRYGHTNLEVLEVIHPVAKNRFVTKRGR